VALIHYPVVNKNGDIIASAVTSLDLHDISRAAKTYGVKSFYVVTPLRDQQALVERIVSHWINGTGSTYNPQRRLALEIIRVRKTLANVIEDIHRHNFGQQPPNTVVTTAQNSHGNLSFERFRELLKNGRPYLLVLGTAWGLAQSVLAEADYVLESVKGKTDYNHLSVRSATAIILDRLLGRSK
jgi:hypothetical protein